MANPIKRSHLLKLTEAEIGIIQSALQTVEPYGGGSDIKCLSDKLARDTGVSYDMAQVQRNTQEVLTSAAEHGEEVIYGQG